MQPSTATESIDHDACERWEQNVIATNPRGPRYGTSEWFALDHDDPRRFRALVIFAAVWRRQLSPEVIRAELIAQLEEEDRSIRRRLVETSHDVSAAFQQPRRRS